MKCTIARPESWKVKAECEVPEEDLKGAYREKLTEYRRKVRMPGFRQGKVPQSLIEARYRDAIRAEVIEGLIEQSFKQACKENNILPISEGTVSSVKADEGQPLTFTVETEIEPEIEIKGYEKLKVKPTPRKIKKSDVQEAIDDLRNRLADFKDVDRPSQKGDYVTIEYRQVKVEGEIKPGVTSPKYPIELGASKIKDFDKGLMGHVVGEVFDISLKFPNDYGDTELAGKRGELAVAMNKVQEKVLPEIDDEFAKKIGNFGNLDLLREQIAKDLQLREIDRAKNEAYNRAVDILISKNTIDIPPSRVESYLKHVHEEAVRQVRAGETPMTRQDVDARFRESGIRAMKRYRIIDHISKRENIKPTQEEVDAEIRKLAERYNQPFEQLKDGFRRDGTANRIRSDLKEMKTLNFLIGESEPLEE